MLTFRRLRHRLAWLACWAVLVGALAPAVSQSLAALRQQAVWSEICSAANSTSNSTGSAVAGSPQAGVPDPADHPADHHSGAACAYCLTHAGSFGLPPTHWLVALPSSVGPDVRPPATVPSPWVTPVAAAQPRGPPTRA